MSKKFKYDESFKNACFKNNYEESNISIVEENQDINPNCGLETIVLTDDHIKALKEGKAVWFDINCGEYAGLILYKGENKTK
ncbi:hypothetical protein J6S88_01040 [bacterium]|nr:hypothetical protein [bacterium]